jgi:hypothetical protein
MLSLFDTHGVRTSGWMAPRMRWLATVSRAATWGFAALLVKGLVDGLRRRQRRRARRFASVAAGLPLLAAAGVRFWQSAARSGGDGEQREQPVPAQPEQPEVSQAV